MNMTHLAAGIWLALGATVAQAASYDLSFGPYSTESDKFSNAPFTDIYNFNFTGASGILSASLIEYKLSNYIDINWPATQALTVYSDWDGQGSTLLSLGNPGTPTGYFAIEDLLVPSHFSIVIHGQAVGNGSSAFQPGLKGSYDLSAVAQPVPEADSGYLLLAGLAVLAVPTLLRKSNMHNRDATMPMDSYRG